MPVSAKSHIPFGVLGFLTVLVILRSSVFVFVPAAHFDSDQAVTGLMAKHLAEGRAFPVFWYGQTYMLGVEAWLAAPVMAIASASVPALKLPLLAINVAIAVLLFVGFTREGLRPWRAAVATLFFVLVPPITAAHFLTANGGNVEPTLYVLLIWFLRRRPILMGVVLGIGFLNREFTIYGFLALILLDAWDGRLFARDAAIRYGGALGAAAAVWIVVMLMRGVSSAAGPGTSMADLSTQLASNNVVQVVERLCLRPAAIASGAKNILTVHWPELFGLESQPLTDFGIESAGRQGFPGAAWLLIPVLLIPAVRLIARRAPRPELPSYLVLVAALSVAGYLVGRCGVIDFYTMRYELLSVLGIAGLAAWYLLREQSRGILAAWLACCALVFGLSSVAHARLLREYATHPPVPLKVELIDALEARGVRYAYADYWTAYYVTFMTRERIIVASDSVVKVRTHNTEVDAHRAEAIRISRRPCDGGEPLTPAFWACRP
jgi:hypothetical protein